MDDREAIDAVEAIGPPNCPVDLIPMEITGTDEHPQWVCPECGLTRIS